ncbi:MAG: hypothetical protein MZV49_09550 [Rhodopseudomonas palustris]|nr:hypothetical protein [Rhodopseudomonas palustris]
MALGLVLLTGVGRPDLVRAGGLRRPRRLHHGAVPRHRRRLRRVAAGSTLLASGSALDRRRRAGAGLRSRCACRGHYLPLATIAWGISALLHCSATCEFLGGYDRASPASRRSSVFGVDAATAGASCYYLIWAVRCWPRIVATHNLLDSRAGPRHPRAEGRHGDGRGDGRARPSATSCMAFLVSRRCWRAVSGWLYAHMQRFVNPTPFAHAHQGIEYLFMAVVGGAGHVWGARARRRR